MLFFLISTIFAHPQYTIGVEALKRKDTSVAERALQKCINDEHHNTDCHWELGWVYWLKKDWKKVVEHWGIIRKIDPNYKTLQTYLPQAQAQLSSKKDIPLTTTDVTAIDDIYRTRGCKNRSDSIRSRTQKYRLNQKTHLLITDCSEITQGALEGNQERIIIQKDNNDAHYHILSLPIIDLSNQILATANIIAARFEGGMLKSSYRNGDWKVRRRWKLSSNGTFFLDQSRIINFSGKKKLDYKQGKKHSYK
jgi:hypothetical protein